MKQIAIVRGKFLNRYEMQFFEPLVGRYSLTAFGSLTPYHDHFRFPVVKLPSPMDVPDFPYKMPVLNRLFTDAHYLLGLETRLKGFDLVHSAETYFRYTQQCLDAKKAGYVGKVVITVLENLPFNNEGIRGRKEYKRRSRTEADHLIALTDKTRQILITEGADPARISVISHFIDTERFRPRAGGAEVRHRGRRPELTVLFVGRLEEYKGIFDIFHAIDILEKDPELDDMSVRLMLVGDGSRRRNVEQLIGRIGKKWHSTLVSANYDEMPGMYRNADVFVAPSKSQVSVRHGVPVPTWEEQYGTVFLEAQASGLPIVSTTSGGIPENVGSAGILVPPGDVKALARALKSFLLDPAKRRRYGKLARQRALRVHDYHIGAEKLAALYDRVLSS